ncbi:MAG: hypothetical protein KKH72_00780 [Alphaproteobacteria bacterium]|nr:hypothetical protein [Alphaproteobacteria bacterium]
MQSPFSDPLTFWSRVLLRLGVVLGLLAVAPAVVDYLVLRGAAVLLAAMALNALMPLAVLCLVGGGGLWVWSRLAR